MERATIDFGIDLGTTNSKIAVFNGSGTTVFKNNDDMEYTPSAVWIDSKGRIYVGRNAKDRLESDSANTYSEFKLQMGTSRVYRFAASERQMFPEELSAEVLKSLRNSVEKRTGEKVTAAVISVPAAFELPQCDATNKAAKLAGLSFSPLIQEPVAAALAYGFQSKSDRVFWMVYDLGGGTFDVAIIQVRDGQILVVNHSGDNHLGGKLIDWDIVERLLVPALTKEYALSDFNRVNPKWNAAFAKLKLKAEQAKIALSNDDSIVITIDPLCIDDKGMPISFEYELKRNEIEPLIEPFIERSINRCKAALEEKRLSPDNIEKLILVGGPTRTPIVRDMLKEKLRITLEFSVDPLTVNAQGAAIFARTQPMSKKVNNMPILVPGQFSLELNYEPIGNDPDPMIGGKIYAPDGKPLTGYKIEFTELKTRWRSGRVPLSADGKFMTTVHAGEQTNEFLIELTDAAGNLCKTVPDRFNYAIGMTISNQPLLHCIGVALANGEMQPFLSKGTPLPAHRREIHRTTISIRKGESGTLLRIPVVEGETTKHADRNTLIGNLIITGDKIKRDLPLESEVEITIDMDESRLIHVKAYVPILDEIFEDILKLGKTTAEPQKLETDYKHQMERLQKVRDNAQQAGITQVEKPIQKIEDEGMLHDIETSLAAAPADPDAADKCQKRLVDLKIILDEAEDALEEPLIISKAHDEAEYMRGIVDKFGDEEEKQNFNALEKEINAAIESNDVGLIKQKLEYLEGLYWRICFKQPGWWVGQLEDIEKRKPHMKDQQLAERLIIQGRGAIDSNNLDALKTVVRQLWGLLPADEQKEIQGYGGTTMPINR
ncbi:MAG: Hsp70 family protein [Dehalococcoidales bacterium]|nr:Hsp70 family protein [Dehalococcoidales bacterium]